MNKTELIARVVELESLIKESNDELSASSAAFGVDLVMTKESLDEKMKSEETLQDKIVVYKSTMEDQRNEIMAYKKANKGLTETVKWYEGMNLFQFFYWKILSGKYFN